MWDLGSNFSITKKCKRVIYNSFELSENDMRRTQRLVKHKRFRGALYPLCRWIYSNHLGQYSHGEGWEQRKSSCDWVGVSHWSPSFSFFYLRKLSPSFMEAGHKTIMFVILRTSWSEIQVENLCFGPFIAQEQNGSQFTITQCNLSLHGLFILRKQWR